MVLTKMMAIPSAMWQVPVAALADLNTSLRPLPQVLIPAFCIPLAPSQDFGKDVST